MESTNDPRLLIGLGAVDEVDRVTIRWPSGAVSTLEHLTHQQAYRGRRAPREGRERGGRCPTQCGIRIEVTATIPGGVAGG